MKKKLLYIPAFILSILAFYTCSNNSTTEVNTNPPQTTSSGYFPNGDQSYYKYSVEKTDSTGAMHSGSRSTTYDGSGTQNGVTYQKQIDSVSIQGTTAVGVSYFRKSDTGVFYFLDTTGFAEVIPDSLKSYITLDAEMRLLLLPLQSGSTWPVFKMNLNYIVLNFNIVELNAAYVGTDSVTLNLNTGTVTKEASKIKYDFNLKLDPFLPTVTYTTYAWLVNDIGFVKWQGNATVIDAFTGGGVNFADTTSAVTMSLIQYKLK
jgi:hypothetical protein